MTASQPKVFELQGAKRRLLFVAFYEMFAIVAASLLFMLTGQSSLHSGVMAVVSSAVAIIWNLSFNWSFEQWELRQQVKGRSFLRRAVHALGFEAGLALILIPIMAWWFSITLWQATVLEAGLLVFFMAYTYVFNWCFDHLFGLPLSAQGPVQNPAQSQS